MSSRVLSVFTLPQELLNDRRITGAILYVSIVYSNPSLFGDIEYSIKVSQDQDDSFLTSSATSSSVTERSRLDTVGIRVYVSQTGTIGSFNIFALLVNLAVGMLCQSMWCWWCVCVC